ncbi:armadillo-type protein [Pavlovales sp. CCMP2436]|nr:armadillo-type protein [Pavlovales sp. CCMP2436]
MDALDSPAAGAGGVALVLPLLDRKLASAADADSDTADRLNGALVACVGCAAMRLGEGDARVNAALSRLLAALHTPAEYVQKAVSGVLARLCARPDVKGRAGDLLADLLFVALPTSDEEAANYPARRGAAYGVAGVVKGAGIPSLKAHGVMVALTAQTSGATSGVKSCGTGREGALMCFELLAATLGRLFEPYAAQIVPCLLVCAADGSGAVRAATAAASRALMAKLSAQGVRMVFPALINALSTAQWRTKQAACELLGATAFCAPKVLAAALPTAVPALQTVLADPHAKVRASAEEALREIGQGAQAGSSSEFAKLAPILLAALASPDKQTAGALRAVAHTRFTQRLDSSSLSLLAPVLLRGLRGDNLAETKRRAAHIAGSLPALMKEQKDVAAVAPDMMPPLRALLADPIPEVRATAAKALGALVGGLGGAAAPEMRDSLRKAMADGTTAVERAGAALALVEVVKALGQDALAAELPAITAGCTSGPASSREGNLVALAHAAGAFGDEARARLPELLDAALSQLGAEADSVRDAATGAARALTAAAQRGSPASAVKALLAKIDDVSWRVRTTVAGLLGGLLATLVEVVKAAAGKKGKGKQIAAAAVSSSEDSEEEDTEEEETEEEEGSGSDESDEDDLSSRPFGCLQLPKNLEREAGAALYIGRFDAHSSARSAFVGEWKRLVSHSARALRLCLKQLTARLLGALADGDEDAQRVAGEALSEVVAKMGDRVFVELLPALRAGLRAPEAHRRVGVCFGLAQAVRAAPREQVRGAAAELLPALTAALCDEVAGVRDAATQALGTLQRAAGSEVLTQALDALLEETAAGGAREEAARRGLTAVTSVKPQVT